jgi:hypothetical protein
MKIMLRAAMAAISLASIGSAYAGEVDAGPIVNTLFTSVPGVVAQAPVQSVPGAAIARNGPVVRVYVTQSSRGTWLFAPSQNGNGGSNG